MKKTLSWLLVLVMVLSLSAVVFADDATANVPSPENTEAPEVIDEPEDTNTAAAAPAKPAIKVTPYDERDTLSAERKAALEEVYANITAVEDLTSLNDKVKEAAGDNLLAVVDLFDINGPEDTEFPATVTIKNRKVDNFVAMVQYVNGEWKFVNAHVDNGLVVATIDQFGEFAILGTLEEASSAQTGESMPYSYLIGAVILAGAAVWFFSKSRKVKA